MGEVRPAYIFFHPLPLLSRSLALFISRLLSLTMVLLAKFGKAVFAMFFIISAWQQLDEFGLDGGPAARYVGPKVDHVTEQVNSKLGVQIPKIEVKCLIATGIAFKGIGGILFAFGYSAGAYLLLVYMAVTAPFLHYFNDHDDPLAIQRLTLDLAIYGMLFYFLGMDRALQMQQARRRSPAGGRPV